ncbi:MAG: lysophospholipid acyltransferase family protein [Pseudomonadota bacterium]
MLILLGLNVRRGKLLPTEGPAIIVANHNSHLDTLVLISLFPLRQLHKIHPIAAADYFLKNRLLAWFSTQIIGIIPISRGKASKSYDPLQPCCNALNNGDIIILFPEGSRGEPEHISQFKKGIAHIAERYPNIPVTPVFIHGLGKALPKGDFVLVPFFCDIFIGNAFYLQSDKQEFMNSLSNQFEALSNEKKFAPWE